MAPLAFVLAFTAATVNNLYPELCDTTRLDRVVRAGAVDEATRLYRLAGVELRWADECGTPPIDQPFSARVYIVEELPIPIRNRLRYFRNQDDPMGYVLAAPQGPPSQIVYVARRPVERYVRRRDRAGEKLGRALGRVIAHELAHRFLRAGHRPTGILKDRFNLDELLGEDPTSLAFSESERQALRARASCRCGRCGSPTSGKTCRR